jgi:hypothetical protein
MPAARTDKLKIADEMLNSAIALFFDYQYFAALNLAGVAQELFGTHVSLSGSINQLDEIIDFSSALAAKQGSPHTSRKKWREIALHPKNRIKHLDSLSDRHIEIDAQDEARLMIEDALSEHGKIGRSYSSTFAKFAEYSREISLNAKKDAGS